MAGATLVYVLPAIRENTHSTSSSPHLKNSASTNKDGCIPGFTCVQTWWSRTLGALIPSYGVMQALDQVRSLSDSVQKLANDTVLALGNIKDTLASHKMMILQNRVAMDYILATQGGACTIIGPECCTGLMDPTENLNKIQQDILGLSAKLHQMTEDNSSWFGNLLGKPWLWIKEIAILLLFSPTCVLSMHPQYQVFLSANDSRLSRGNDSSNQKRLLPVRTSRTLIACFVSVSACNYI